MREVVLDPALMYQVVVGVSIPGATEAVRRRCEAAAEHFRWNGEKLFIRGQDGEER